MNRHSILEGPLGRIASAARLPDVLLFLVALIVVAPIWAVERPPLQDFPQHVAAVRVLSSYFDPSFRFQEYFELTIGRTQYLTVYLLAAPFARVIGPTLATKLVLSVALALTPLAIARWLRALSMDAWLAWLSLPFVFNVHVGYGFINFVAAIPLMFLGLALAIEGQQQPSRKGAWALAVVLILCFFTHVVPFGLLAIAVVLLVRWDRRTFCQQLAVLAPAFVAACVWLLKSPAGKVVASVGRSFDELMPTATHLPFGASLRMLPDWIINISNSEAENLRIVVWLVTAVVLLVLCATFPNDEVERGKPEANALPNAARWSRFVVMLLVPLSLVAYFSLPNGFGFIWPICQRFPVLAMLLALPLLGRAPRWPLRAAALLSATLAVLGATELVQLFRDTSRQGYRGFDEVIERIPKGSRVATLVFERRLDGLQLSPLIHAAGWVQAERGGVVMFTFAEFPSSPFAYRSNRRPPPVPPRWEWGPERVVPDRDLGWYDFCLVQGWSGSLEASRRFQEVARRGRWSLWQRTGPADTTR
ncbi:MAG TPA: hypothetical protein VIV60_07610 [Polyangiaceae bacterium]